MSSFQTKRFWQIDVFTRELYRGNPAAVVFDAEGIPAATMQAIAREMNLSETVFLLPPTQPGADYRVRIFTPRAELPFAGHPTVAAAYAVTRSRYLEGAAPAAAGAAPRPARLHQECGIGLVPVDVTGEHEADLHLVMTQGRPSWQTLPFSRAEAARALGCPEAALAEGLPVQLVSTGLPWIIVALADPAALGRSNPDLGLIEAWSRRYEAAGVTAFALYPETRADGVRTKVRSFAPADGIMEDPVCGSGNGCVAAYQARHGLLPGTSSWWAEQGAEIARDGRVFVSVEPVPAAGAPGGTDAGGGSEAGEGSWRVRVGGSARRVLVGDLDVPAA